jgi:hypothetical protein
VKDKVLEISSESSDDKVHTVFPEAGDEMYIARKPV